MAASDITVAGLTATGDVKGIKLAWTYSDPRNNALPNIGLDMVEVHASTTNDRTTATKVGEGITDFLHAGLSRGDVRYYWAKARDNIGGFGPWYPASPTGGVVGTEVSGDVLIAQNGYWKHPSGLIEQWGRDALVGGGSTTIIFPEPFPNQCFQVIANPLASPSSSILYAIEVETFDTTTVALTPNRVSGGTVTSPAMTALWRAIGFCHDQEIGEDQARRWFRGDGPGICSDRARKRGGVHPGF
jgi:hypothetical protein